MGALDYLFKMAEGNPVDVEMVIDDSGRTGLTIDSSDIEILDYIMLQLCFCLDTTKMAFKGGYVLNKIITDEIPRATIDVDFSIAVKEYYEVVKNVLNNIGMSLVSEKIIDSYEIKETIAERSSGGIKLHRESSQKRDLGIDVGLHGIDYGVVPLQLFGMDLQRFSVERMLSDKLSAIFSRKRFRRPKDLYDFYIITNCFNVNMYELTALIEKRGGLDFNATPFDARVLVEYKKAYDSLQVRQIGNDIISVEKPDFEKTIQRLSNFVEALGMAFQEWNCGTRTFK